MRSCLCARGNRYMTTLENVSFFSIRQSRALWFLPLLLALACCSTASAQMSAQGTVTVAVVDPTGGSVQGAKLQLQDVARKLVRDAERQQFGRHTVGGVRSGTHKLP